MICVCNVTAVEDLLNISDLLDTIRPQMRQLPDLERLLSRIHSMGVGRDRNAVMYGNVALKQLNMFISLLRGFESCVKIIALCSKYHSRFTSARLVHLTTIGAGFPKELEQTLDFFRNSFDESTHHPPDSCVYFSFSTTTTSCQVVVVTHSQFARWPFHNFYYFRRFLQYLNVHLHTFVCMYVCMYVFMNV
jgi:hypothetical protein